MALNEERRYHPPSTTRPQSKAVKLSPFEIKNTINYLTNPTSIGFFRVEADWAYSDGITGYIKNTSEKKIGRRKVNADLYRRRMAEGLRRSEKITFLFTLFKILHTTNTPAQARSLAADDYTFHLLDVDFARIRKEYAEALEFFANNIYYDGLGSVRNITKIKSGTFLVMAGPKDGGPKLEVISLSAAPVRDLQEFLQLVGKINNASHYTVFSPEEELLSPYIAITKSMLNQIAMPESIKSHFSKMISDYDNDNFTGCVSTAGLVAEELLTQVYETLSRKPVPRNLMLGQIARQIGELTKQLRSPANTAKPQNKTRTLSMVKHQTKSKDTISMLMFTTDTILQYVDASSTSLQHKLLQLKKDDGSVDFSLFPRTVKLSLDDVILYRNNASHKSPYPIGSLEALKSVYGSLSLLIWWNSQKKTIDGSKSHEEVLESLVDAAKTYDTSQGHPPVS